MLVTILEQLLVGVGGCVGSITLSTALYRRVMYTLHCRVKAESELNPALGTPQDLCCAVSLPALSLPAPPAARQLPCIWPKLAQLSALHCISYPTSLLGLLLDLKPAPSFIYSLPILVITSKICLF